MIPEVGHYALILAFCLAIVQASFPLVGAWYNNLHYMQLSRYTAIGQLLFVSVSFFALAYAFVSNDFSLVYVVKNSNTQLPFIYRFCAVWGAHEGSLLLWVFILSIWTAAVSIFSRSLPLTVLSRVLSVLALIAIGFYLFLLTTSNPFTRLLAHIPVNGNDLNPLLQDPGLVSHPPMLYMGYVGFSVAFAFAIAALIGGKLDAAWARWSRPWTIIAWCFLTLGIVLGSWWAYRELGWGGWWFWDPVENASFLPWLAGTALIHSLLISEKRNIFKAWTVLLAVCAFSLSLVGTFLVRSGVLISVHAFAVDPARGAFILEFLSLVIGGSLILYAWRAKYIMSAGQFNFWSRETMLLMNNIILFVAMITVLLGTIYPIIIEALHFGKVSVGAPYFNIVMAPLMIPLLFLMGIGPLFHWRYRNPKTLIQRLSIILLLSLFFAIALPIILGVKTKVSVVIGLTLALWIILNTATHITLRWMNFSRAAMILAHFGVAVTLSGIVLTTAYSEHRDLSMKPGETAKVSSYEFQFLHVASLQGPNYTGARAAIAVRRNHELITILRPEQRIYNVTQTAMAKTDIDAKIFRDLYVALASPLADGSWGMRIYYKPFVRWIWFGGFLMIIGGVCSLLGRCYREKKYG